MTHAKDFPLETLQFYTTASYPCSYLPNRQARSLVATPSHLISSATYSALVQNGFRRSGLFTYRPACEGCNACIPLRVRALQFKPNRSQRRAWTQHQGLQIRTLEPSFQPEHYALYLRYQAARHAGGGMDQDSVVQYTQFLMQSHVNTRLIEFREPAPGNSSGILRMICLIDELRDGWSAVYTFYDPNPQANYGTWGILWQIKQAQRVNLPFVYLGYWIAASPKMAYKTRFQPYELWENGKWSRGPSQPHPTSPAPQATDRKTTLTITSRKPR